MSSATTTSARRPQVRQRAAPGARRENEIQTRLHRASGQLTGVTRMHADGRYCIDVLDQLAAITAALDAVALLVLEDHIHACVRESVDSADPARTEEMVAELAGAVRRYVRSR
jgi:DNA-binding FrmR family transcriptional regulator